MLLKGLIVFWRVMSEDTSDFSRRLLNCRFHFLVWPWNDSSPWSLLSWWISRFRSAIWHSTHIRGTAMAAISLSVREKGAKAEISSKKTRRIWFWRSGYQFSPRLRGPGFTDGCHLFTFTRKEHSTVHCAANRKYQTQQQPDNTEGNARQCSTRSGTTKRVYEGKILNALVEVSKDMFYNGSHLATGLMIARLGVSII